MAARILTFLYSTPNSGEYLMCMTNVTFSHKKLHASMEQVWMCEKRDWIILKYLYFINHIDLRSACTIIILIFLSTKQDQSVHILKRYFRWTQNCLYQTKKEINRSTKMPMSIHQNCLHLWRKEYNYPVIV
jgi:hypothetical protein